ncbi:MAG: CPBP family intramembrane metalloprotease [Flavobacteriales bacterium]|nr:CPBP family intramembrane metalloprotease [Flavobacteriales bacterium]
MEEAIEPATPPPGPKLALGLALFTVVVLGGGGAWLIVSVQERSLVDLLIGSSPWYVQTIIGIIGGWLIAIGGWWIITRTWLEPVRVRYTNLIGPLLTGRWIQIIVSICAGVGEEILFRGCLQHWLGITLTAFGFVALHGYLNPRDLRVSAYGLYMSAAMIALGVVADHFGLIAPIVAHTVIDIVLIDRLVKDWRKRAV